MVKKIMIVSVLLTVVLAVQAQMGLTIAPKMEKGVEKNYTSVVTYSIPGQMECKMTADQKITVADATADSYILDLVTTEFSTDAAADNLAAQMVAAGEEMMKGVVFRLATDKYGKVVKLENYEALKPQIDATADQFADKMFKAVPQLEQMMPKDVLKQQITESLTEESLLKSMQESTSVLALNGKTVMTGAQEEFLNKDGLKMKRMYFVNGKNITTNSSMNMTKEEMKKLIIEQVEKLMPEQANMIKENIDQVMDSGMLKMEMKETATYEMQDDGWMKSIKADTTNESMGQTVTINTVVTLK